MSEPTVHTRTIPEINRDIGKIEDNIRFNELLLSAEWLPKQVAHEQAKIEKCLAFIRFLNDSRAKAPTEVDRLNAIRLCLEEELLSAQQDQAARNFKREPGQAKASASVSKLLAGVDTHELIIRCIMQQHRISREAAESLLEQGKVSQL